VFRVGVGKAFVGLASSSPRGLTGLTTDGLWHLNFLKSACGQIQHPHLRRIGKIRNLVFEFFWWLGTLACCNYKSLPNLSQVIGKRVDFDFWLDNPEVGDWWAQAKLVGPGCASMGPMGFNGPQRLHGRHGPHEPEWASIGAPRAPWAPWTPWAPWAPIGPNGPQWAPMVPHGPWKKNLSRALYFASKVTHGHMGS